MARKARPSAAAALALGRQRLHVLGLDVVGLVPRVAPPVGDGRIGPAHGAGKGSDPRPAGVGTPSPGRHAVTGSRRPPTGRSAAARRSSQAWSITAAATLSTTRRRSSARISASMSDAVGGDRRQPLVERLDRAPPPPRPAPPSRRGRPGRPGRASRPGRGAGRRPPARPPPRPPARRCGRGRCRPVPDRARTVSGGRDGAAAVADGDADALRPEVEPEHPHGAVSRRRRRGPMAAPRRRRCAAPRRRRTGPCRPPPRRRPCRPRHP